MTIKPHIIQSDNGAEFKNYNTIAWYKENNINYMLTLPYAPESNGLVENFYKQLRRMIRKIFIETIIKNGLTIYKYVMKTKSLNLK